MNSRRLKDLGKVKVIQSETGLRRSISIAWLVPD